MSLSKSPFIRVAIKGYLGWRFDTDLIKRIVLETSEKVEAETRAQLSGGGAGRSYALKGGGLYQASAAGALPAMRSGDLAKSILARRSRDGLSAWIGPSTKAGLKKPFYPAFLIYGAERGAKGGTLAKRKNASAVAARRYRTRFNRELAAAMQKAVQPGPPA